MDTVWISHPRLDDRKVEVPASALLEHQRAGWVLVDAPDRRPETIQALIDGGWEPEEARKAVEAAMPDPPGSPPAGGQTDQAPEDTSGASSLPETGPRVRRTTRGEQ
ncbi:hypothetical protein ACGF0J_22035 [Nonomuraea sp. NPDC047897]|uniref:hypothetical protein n=1 Tax=Nonomuraea sp. NPDC047897 TaxID=3364346 RepID=UPI003717BADC